MFCFYGAGDRMQGFLRAREHSAFLCDFAGNSCQTMRMLERQPRVELEGNPIHNPNTDLGLQESPGTAATKPGELADIN